MQAKSNPGVIALDIDGTITHGTELSPAVKIYLEKLMEQGWQLIFLTGRTFSFSLPILSQIQGKFKVVVQNGAATLEMPTKKVVSTCSLPKEKLYEWDSLFHGKSFGLLVESGADQEDVCYYKEHDFSPPEREYLAFRDRLCPERWVKVDSFEEIPVNHFAVGKYFAKRDVALQIKEQIIGARVTVIRDPFREGFDLGLINHPQATKGNALKPFVAGKKLIAAGDDWNDVEMLEKADVKIVMPHAPAQVLKMADIVGEMGIIKALEEAFRR